MDFLTKFNGAVWSTPIMLLLLGISIVYCFGMRFGTMRNWKMQFKLLGSSDGSDDGLSPLETFFTVAAYRVAVGNVSGVALAISYGGPLVVSGQSANQIGLAFQNSLGISPVITGIIIAILLFLIISGGINRIAKFSTFIVPIMTCMYFAIMVIVMIVNRQNIPNMFHLIITSAFNKGSVFGGMMGAAVQYGVKRSVNSSGAGMGETPCTAAAANNRHPAQQGLVNAFTVYINIIVCFCSSFLILVSDCYNVTKVPNSVAQGFRYVGKGSPVLKYAAQHKLAAAVTWVQAAANTALPKVGGIIIALAITFFAFSTVVAYYYEGESALAYLMRDSSYKKRGIAMFILRIAMTVMFFVWATQSADMAWKAGEIALGLMVWINAIAMIPTFPTVIKIYNDFIKQWKAGDPDPYFNPKKLGIKNCDIWLDINKDRIEADEAKAAADTPTPQTE